MITTTPITIAVPSTVPPEAAPGLPGDPAALALAPFAGILEAALDPREDPKAKPASKRVQPRDPAEPSPAIANVALPVMVPVEPAPAVPVTEPKVEAKPNARMEPKIDPRIAPKIEPKTEPKADPKADPAIEPGTQAAPVLQEPVPASPPPSPSPAPSVAPSVALLAAPASTHAAAPAQPAHPMHVAVPIGAPGFDEAFAARVTVAVRAGTESASIALNPPELGPVEMRVSVSEGEAHVAFAVEQPLAREAILDVLPRLREMLSAHGLSLADASVGADLPRRGPQDSVPVEGTPAQEPQEALPERTAEVRLVDVFA